MPAMFHDVRLPDDIEQGAIGGPSFQTNITSISSGAEQRAALWDRVKLVWAVGYGIQDKEDYEALIAFFYARRGKAFGFRFRDWSDYQATAELIGTGNGGNRVFRLKKSYASGSETFTRTITHPDLAEPFEIRVDGVLIDPANYDVEDLGIVRFHAGHAPAISKAVTWSGQFDVPVRFDTDDFNLTLGALASGELVGNALPVVELREQLNSPPSAIEAVQTLSTIDEGSDTSSPIQVATFDLVDDDLGVNTYGLTGANPAFFEVVLSLDTRSGTLYLKAGDVLSHAATPTLQVTLGVWDTVVGARPSATQSFSLTVAEVARAPVVVLTNETHGLLLNADTTARTLLADISATANLAQSVTVTLTGSDASHFELFGGNLYLKAAEDTTGAHHYDVTIHAADGAGTTDVDFQLTIGVVPAVHLYDTAGTFTLTVPEYATLKIEVQEAGNGSWGYTPGTAVPPTAPGRTYVQNDQTVTLFHRWRVEGQLMADNPDAFTPGFTVATATQNSLGIGASLEAASQGVQGGVGVPFGTQSLTYDAPSGPGGYSMWDSAVILGGASVRTGDAPTDGTAITANGNNGGVPGSGASGCVYKKNTLAAGQTTPTFGGGTNQTNDFAATAGGASGMFAQYTWTYGSAQVGSGAGYTAPAPAVGDVLTIVIGAGGVKGTGTASGGNGAHGRVRITVG